MADAAAAFAARDEDERRRADEVRQANESAARQWATLIPETPFDGLARRVDGLARRLGEIETRLAQLETDAGACVDIAIERKRRPEND
ncbi:MAG: hypothetical protein WB383_08330 [Acidimicrobiales bacterium]